MRWPPNGVRVVPSSPAAKKQADDQPPIPDGVPTTRETVYFPTVNEMKAGREAEKEVPKEYAVIKGHAELSARSTRARGKDARPAAIVIVRNSGCGSVPFAQFNHRSVANAVGTAKAFGAYRSHCCRHVYQSSGE